MGGGWIGDGGTGGNTGPGPGWGSNGAGGGGGGGTGNGLGLRLGSRRRQDCVVHGLHPAPQLRQLGRIGRPDPQLAAAGDQGKGLFAGNAHGSPRKRSRRAEDVAVENGYVHLLFRATSNANSVPSTPATTFWLSTEKKAAYSGEDLAEKDVQRSDAHARAPLDVDIPVGYRSTAMTSGFVSISSPRCRRYRGTLARRRPDRKMGPRKDRRRNADVACRVSRIDSRHHDEPGRRRFSAGGGRG